MKGVAGGKYPQQYELSEFEKAADEFLNNAEYRAAVESKSGVAARMEAVAEALRNEARK